MLKLKVISQIIAATITTSLLAGCGSDSDNTNVNDSTSTNVSKTRISGSVFTPNVVGAQIEVTDINGNKMAEPVTTDSNGLFTVAIPNANLNDDLLFIATGGSYTNAITGKGNIESKRLATFAAANSLTKTPVINLTAASTIIENITSSIDDNAKAMEYFETAFGYQPNISVLPVTANQENKTASEEAKLAGVRAAAFNQLLNDLGLAGDKQTDLLTAIAKDLEDGTADGKNNSQPVQIINGTNLNTDIANRFTMALIDFAKDTVLNKSGINPGKVSVLAFNKKVVSTNYQFELTPQSMPMKGKSVFNLKITDNSDSAVVDITPTILPMMYMANEHIHSTPHTGCTKTNAQGLSECTSYFVMPSGENIGNWELTFSVGTSGNQEKARFFPSVGMPMGENTAWLALFGTDKALAGGASNRLYLFYKNDIVEKNSGHTVKFFIATKELMLNKESKVVIKDWPLLEDTDVTVKIGTEKTSLIEATSEDNGIWSIDLDGLTVGELNTVYVQLSRDGDIKKHGGNEIAEFKLTPTK